MTRSQANMALNQRPLLVLGIMSGTSIDSVDFAVCSVRECAIVLRQYWQAPFPGWLRRRLVEAARGDSRSHELAQLHHDLGRFYADEARRGLGKRKPCLVGLHGQTIFHRPATHNAATFQLGEPAYLAETLGVPVVNNFRAADLAAGGQGAPLATLFHKVVFGEIGRHVCINNLGGISNVTSLDWRRGQKPNISAFDTGPANMLIDLAVQRLTQGKARMDADGRWARKGTVCEELLAKWMRHPYFFQKPPKSTGREMFGERFLVPALSEMKRRKLSKFDLLATFTELTARSIVLNYRLHLPAKLERVILAGGGAANSFLVERIREQFGLLHPGLMETCEARGWPLQSVEPAAFALLAFYRFIGKSGNMPATTGARRAVLLGQVSGKC
ncbi:MAG: anhydro-N-acetylmuramic acid kinase [Verrucomicrobia bacterium]|nr:anhydro-N-acetylmuramic acid kinase [Verrucomicrobiota bacterium]